MDSDRKTKRRSAAETDYLRHDSKEKKKNNKQNIVKQLASI